MYAQAPSPAQTEEEPEYEGFEDSRYKAWWREWVDSYGDARRQSFRDQEYYDGDVKGTGWGHWTSEALEKLTKRNQPPTTRNLVCRGVNAVSGIEQRSRAEPRAMPRTPKDQHAAEIATDTLRFIKEQTNLPMTSARGFLQALVSGYAATEIQGAEDHVHEELIEWRDFAFDPRSRRNDFSDARWLAIAKWMDIDVAKETYVPAIPSPPQIPPQPQDPAQLQEWAAYAQQAIAVYRKEVARAEGIEARIEATSVGSHLASIEDYEDHPSEVFCDSKRKRIFVVDMWHRDPKHGWYRCVFTGGGKLFTEAATLVERDRWGRDTKTHPIKAFSLFVSRDGWRYGIVRNMRSPQDEVNFRLSKKIHYLATNQLFYEPGAIIDGDIENARREINKPDGVIQVRSITGYKVEKNLDVALALDQAQRDASEFLEMGGPNPQLQGEQGRATSGRAVQLLQQAGLGALGPVFDRFHEWEDERYRAYWARAQQYWTAPMYVRVSDDKNAARFAAVNGAPVWKPGQQPAGIGHNGGPPMQMGDMGEDQETGPMLAELDMDIVIDRAPEAATLQAEQFETLSQLAQAGVLGPPNPETARLIIAASSLPTKSQLLDMLDKAAQQPQQPSPQQVAELKELAAKVEMLIAQRDKTRAETAKISAEIPVAQAKADLTGAQARTENINATMTGIGASHALRFGSAALDFDPPAAGEAPGAFDLPPQAANGPPPFDQGVVVPGSRYEP